MEVSVPCVIATFAPTPLKRFITVETRSAPRGAAPEKRISREVRSYFWIAEMILSSE
jgi:hypothetical protein